MYKIIKILKLNNGTVIKYAANPALVDGDCCMSTILYMYLYTQVSSYVSRNKLLI